MAAEVKKEIQLEIAHVLFTDIVGYSKLPINAQRALVERLNEIVRATEEVKAAEAAGRLIKIPTGDGITLVFYGSPEAPVECALEISRALKKHPELQLRMGIHSGPVSGVIDVTGKANVAGAGINMAQRVMDCGDAGHILLSRHVAEDLEQYPHWQPHLHELGECEVKHGVRVSVVNLYTEELGNPAVPEKLKAARLAAAAERKRAAFRRRSVVALALLAAVAAIGFLFFRTKQPPVSAGLAIPEKSIAVLPFENFSEDKANGYFADGIQDDILTALAKIGGLRVISRTSVESYRGSKESRNLPQIAKALGVSNVLEGSVHRVVDRMIINVQLIDALQDRHLWADKYDLSLQDSLGIDGQIAREIASKLGVKLTQDEAARVGGKPTENTQAYDLFLQAKQFEFKPDTFLQDYKTAEQLYVQAITMDPKFALAHARLAATRARIYHFYEPTETWSKSARAEAALALQLQPNLGEAHHALGLCYYWFERDYSKALREFEIAKALLPNDSSVPWDIAAIKRRQGQWNEAVADYRRILTLDPQNANVVRDLLYVYCAMRDWPNAESSAQRLMVLTPDSLNAKEQIGYVDFWKNGSTARLESEMATVPPGKDPDGSVSSCRMDASLIDRDAAAVAQILDSSPLEIFSYFTGVDTPRSFFAGGAAMLRGDRATAQKELEHAREIFAAAVQETPDVAERHAFLGLTCALLGEKERAIDEGKRAAELRPESIDAVDGALINAVLALIYARTGENSRAIELIQHLLAVPGAVDSANYSITINDLKYRWEWDPLRNDPRFQKLAASDAPKSGDK